MVPIVKAPAEVLRTPAKPVEKIDKKLLTVIADMHHALMVQKDPEGVGIAAPQIGSPLQIFFVRPLSGNTKSYPPPQLFINPQITNLSRDLIKPKSKNAMLEGCLSLQHYYGHVTRSKSVTTKFKTFDFSFPSTLKQITWPPEIEKLIIEKTETFSDFPAQIVQHEFDHLQGILFIDRILEQNGKLYEIHGDEWTRVNL